VAATGVEGTRDAPRREEERRRADTIGEPRARRVINNRATAPAPRGVPAYPSRSFLRPPASAAANSSRSFLRWSPRARAPLETAYRSRQKTLGCSRRLTDADETLKGSRVVVCGVYFREGFVFYLSASSRAFFPSCSGMTAISRTI